MAVSTYEGVVGKGKIRLKAGIKLPEEAKVYIIVPDLKMDKKRAIQILSPRLVHLDSPANEDY
jgi:hypothetical protein